MSRALAIVLSFWLARSATAEDLTLCREAWELSESDKNDRALELYGECVRNGDLSPASLAWAQRNTGILLFNKKEPALAADAFGRALAANPKDPWQDYVNRGNAWLEAAEPRKALADFEKALELKPDHAQAIYGRGIAYERLGLEFDAYAEFARASKLGLASDGLAHWLRYYEALGLDRSAALAGDGFGVLGSSYSIKSGARARKLGAISESQAACSMEDPTPSALSEHPSAMSLRETGRFEFPGGGVAVVFPEVVELETVDVRVRLGDHSRGVSDDYLVFASGSAGLARAAVVRTTLAKRMQTSVEVHRAVLDQLDELGAGFAREDLAVRNVDGPWGPLIELLVRNRTGGGICFPTSTFTRASPQDGTTIGVSRYIHRGELLIEIARIVSIPKDLPIAEQGEYARKRMDELMGSISIPP